MASLDQNTKSQPRRSFLKTAGIGISALVAPNLVRQATPTQRPPNILFILIDDLGWLDTTVYGSEYYETPNIERLARRSMRFTDAYAANPLCSPTRASIISGKYPARLGITTTTDHLKPSPPDEPLFAEQGAPFQEVITPRSRSFLPLEEFTLAEALKEAGYHTGFIGKWHLGLPEEHWPPAQGFDVNVAGAGYPSPPSYFSPYRIETLPDGPEGEYIADRLTDETLQYLDDHRDEPFFLCLWHYSVHAPYDSKEDYTDRYRDREDPRGLQDNPVMAGMIRSMDESIGRVLDHLDKLQLTGNTIIIFSSDNGGNEYDRVGEANWKPTNNDPLRSGKGSIYEGGVRVPMMVSWPGVVEPETTCSEVTTSVDFYPTILEMAGVLRSADQILDGESIVPLLRQSDSWTREAIFCHMPHLVEAATGRLGEPATWVRHGDWKLIRFYATSETFPNKYELYNLREDIGESHNLAAAMPKKVQELDASIDRFLEQTGALVPRPNPAYDPYYDPEALPVVDGWRPSGRCLLKRGDNTIVIESHGVDPYVWTDNTPQAAGALLIQFRMRSTSDGGGQFFWTDDQHRDFGPHARLNFRTMHDGEWHEYELSFNAEGKLRQLRIDPSWAVGTMEIDWVKVVDEGNVVLKAWEFIDQATREQPGALASPDSNAATTSTSSAPTELQR